MSHDPYLSILYSSLRKLSSQEAGWNTPMFVDVISYWNQNKKGGFQFCEVHLYVFYSRISMNHIIAVL